MDRPSRKTKVINYFDFDDDEDFACTKAPASKKPREDIQLERRKASSKSSSQETDSQPTTTRKNRKPLDNKLYERDLEAALTLSLLHAADDTSVDQTPTHKENIKDPLQADESTEPSSHCHSNCSVNGTLLGLDEISAQLELPGPRKQKASPEDREPQRSKLKDQDEDYEPKCTPDSESDDDFSEQAESGDELFTMKKVNKKSKKVTKMDKAKPPPTTKREKHTPKTLKAKTPATASTPLRTPPAKKESEARTPASNTPLPSCKPASPAGGRVPKWTPPGQLGRSPTSSLSPAVRSPGQGLRLGLSRLVRVKPLHPSVASH